MLGVMRAPLPSPTDHPALSAAALAALLTVLGTWPLVTDLGGLALDGAYWGNQAWSVATAGQALWEGEQLTRTRAAGWPVERDVRHLGWLILGIGALLRPVLSAGAVTNLALLAGPPLCAAVMGAWLGRLLPDSRPAARIFAALTYALAPHFVCNLANAEAAKAQFWLVPLTLWACQRGVGRWGALPLAWGAAAVLAFTEPYGFMVALLALPVLAGALGQRADWRRWAALGVGLLALGLLARHYYSPPGLGLSQSIYAPASAPQLATMRLELPFSSAPLGALFWPPDERAPSGTQHGVYLGWALLGVAGWGAWVGRAALRTRAGWLGLALALLGVVSALGPLLFLGRERPTGLPLPMMLAEWLHLPIASGGMYYRLLHIGLIGLAVLAARAPLGPLPALLAGALALGELRLAVLAGLPLPVAALPFPTAVAALRADPHPGAVMTLPAYPEGVASKEWAFRFAVAHGRPTTDLPRRPDAPVDWPPLAMNLDRCVSADPRCEVPRALRATLEQAGIRALTLWEEGGQDTRRLRQALTGQLGEPRCAEGLCWWLLDCRDPAQVPVRTAPARGGPGGAPGPRRPQHSPHAPARR